MRVEYAVHEFEEMANDRIVRQARRRVKEGTHHWIPDPEHADVFGLVEVENARRAIVVVYMDGAEPDFECDPALDVR